MYASTITKALSVAADADGIAQTQDLAAAGYLTLNGALVSAGVAILGSQRRVIITSAGDDTGLLFTVIGTDDGGNLIKDIFAGADTAAAPSNLNFSTVISIYSSGATASTGVIAGTNGVGESPWKMFSDTIANPNISFTAGLTGTANYSVQYTQEPFLTPIPNYQPNSTVANGPATRNPLAFDFTNMSGKSADAQGAETFVFHAWRLKINSGTGSVRCSGRQAGLASP